MMKATTITNIYKQLFSNNVYPQDIQGIQGIKAKFSRHWLLKYFLMCVFREGL